MTTKETILKFIKNFQNDGTIKTFTEGCCYWFTLILFERFNMDINKEDNSCKLMYNQIEGHFACEINGELFDITGHIELTEEWESFTDWFLKEPVYRETVVRDCILKTEQQ